VEVHPATVQIVLRLAAFFPRPGDLATQLRSLVGRLPPDHRWTTETGDEAQVRVTIPCRLKFHGGRILATNADGRPLDTMARRDPTLVKALKMAHGLLAEIGDAPMAAPHQAVLRASPPGPYERSLLRMAFLAPDLQAQILEGRQPRGLNLQWFLAAEIQPAWADQRRMFEDLG
jgi:site-specific DNA recombinase